MQRKLKEAISHLVGAAVRLGTVVTRQAFQLSAGAQRTAAGGIRTLGEIVHHSADIAEQAESEGLAGMRTVARGPTEHIGDVRDLMRGGRRTRRLRHHRRRTRRRRRRNRRGRKRRTRAVRRRRR